MYLKFGLAEQLKMLGLKQDEALCQEIKQNLVTLYDGKFPEERLNQYLKYFEIKVLFFETIDKFQKSIFVNRIKVRNQNLTLKKLKNYY